jgi:hypothetical protein
MVHLKLLSFAICLGRTDLYKADKLFVKHNNQILC